MGSSTIQKTAVLSKVRLEFSNFRRSRHQGGKGNGYPKALQRLAVAALEQGGTPSEVSDAAGVTSESLRNWRRSIRGASCVGQARPVELQLLESRELLSPPIPPSPEKSISAPSSEAGAMARIELRSGVGMVLPVSALSERLISLLTGGVS